MALLGPFGKWAQNLRTKAQATSLPPTRFELRAQYNKASPLLPTCFEFQALFLVHYLVFDMFQTKIRCTLFLNKSNTF